MTPSAHIKRERERERETRRPRAAKGRVAVPSRRTPSSGSFFLTFSWEEGTPFGGQSHGPSLRHAGRWKRRCDRRAGREEGRGGTRGTPPKQNTPPLLPKYIASPGEKGGRRGRVRGSKVQRGCPRTQRGKEGRSVASPSRARGSSACDSSRRREAPQGGAPGSTAAKSRKQGGSGYQRSARNLRRSLGRKSEAGQDRASDGRRASGWRSAEPSHLSREIHGKKTEITSSHENS